MAVVHTHGRCHLDRYRPEICVLWYCDPSASRMRMQLQCIVEVVRGVFLEVVYVLYDVSAYKATMNRSEKAVSVLYPPTLGSCLNGSVFCCSLCIRIAIEFSRLLG
jgi:hypothetical protein